MNTNYRISTIIPAFNSAKYISEAIESISNQTYKPYEVIVVDDGSSDETVRIIKEKYPDIILIESINAGPSNARNMGAKAASGDWLAFLDADDIWEKNHLSNAAGILAYDPEIKWCAGAFSLIDGNGKNILLSCYNGKHYKNKTIKNIFLACDDFNNRSKTEIISTCAMVLRKDVFIEFNGFDEKLGSGEDIDLWFRIATKYPNIGYSQDINFFYRRINDSSITMSFNGTLISNKQFERIYQTWSFVEGFSKQDKKIFSKWLNVWIYRLFKRSVKEKNYSVINKASVFLRDMNLKNRMLCKLLPCLKVLQ